MMIINFNTDLKNNLKPQQYFKNFILFSSLIIGSFFATQSWASQCDNGIDDDGDGLVDTYDLGCTGPNDTETIPAADPATGLSRKNGWTVFKPVYGSADPVNDTKIVFVSSTDPNRNDTTCHGYTHAELNVLKATNPPYRDLVPCATLLGGYAKMRPVNYSQGEGAHYPDGLLLKKEDVFTGPWYPVAWQKGGVSKDKRMVIASYGTGARPVSDKPLTLTRGAMAVVGIEFQGPPQGNENFALSTGMPTGADYLRRAGILFEDNKISRFQIGVNISGGDGSDNLDNVEIRNNVIDHTFSVYGGHAQCMLLGGIDHLLVEGNTLNVCGFDGTRTPTRTGPNGNPNVENATGYSHALYMGSALPNANILNNVILEGSSNGISYNGAGTEQGWGKIDNNYIAKTPLPIFMRAAGVRASNNVIGYGMDIVPIYHNGGNGILLAGAYYNPGGSAVIEKNLILNKSDVIGRGSAIYLGGKDGLDNPNIDAVVRNNIAYNWNGAGFYVGNTLDNYGRIVIDHNIFNEFRLSDYLLYFNLEVPRTSQDFDNFNSKLHFSNNKYDNRAPDNPLSRTSFRLRFLNEYRYFPDFWQPNIEPSALRELVPQSSPTLQSVDLGTYQNSLGRTASYEAFVNEVLQQSKSNWRTEYTAPAVNNYFRNQFAMTYSVPTNQFPIIQIDRVGPIHLNDPVTLNARITDDSPQIKVQWSIRRADYGEVNFDNNGFGQPSTETTINGSGLHNVSIPVTFSTDDTYKIQLTVDDGELKKVAVVTVVVNPELAPPAAPTNLTATSPIFSAVNVSWMDNSRNEGTNEQGIIDRPGFVIERRTGTSGSFQEIARIAANTTRDHHTTSFSDETVAEHTQYSYRVYALNSYGNSAYTNEATVTTLAKGTDACNDGIDNDGDGLVDWTNDPGCSSRNDRSEAAGTLAEKNGWTTFNKSPSTNGIDNGTKIVYVSSSMGNNAWSGFCPKFVSGTNPICGPKATIMEGYNLLRPNSPDWLLLKAGDVFDSTLTGNSITRNYALLSNLAKSGRSSTEKMLISRYGPGDDPVLKQSIQLGNDHPFGHVAIVGLNLEGPAQLFSPFPGMNFSANGGDIDLLVEGCKVMYFGNGMIINGPDSSHVIENVKLRRNVVTNNRGIGSPGDHDQGLLISFVKHMEIVENVVDRNGWGLRGETRSSSNGNNVFSHDMYLGVGLEDVIIKGNTVTDASSNCISFNGSGIIEDNFMDHCPIGIVGRAGSRTDNGTTIHNMIRNNVIIGMNDIEPNVGRGAGILVGDHGYNNPGTITVENNIIANRLLNNVSGMPGIQLGGRGDATHAPVEATIRNNIVHNANSTAYAPSQTYATDPFGQIRVSGNIFNDPVCSSNETCVTSLIFHNVPLTGFTYSGNQYNFHSTPNNSQTNGRWFNLDSNFKTIEEWQNLVERDATVFTGSFRDPNRTLGTYNLTLGGEGTYEAFMERAKNQSKFNWDANLMAEAINRYIRSGFQFAEAPTNTAPVISSLPSTATVTLPATLPLTATVTDDGLPNPPGQVTVSWSKLNGSGTVTFSPASSASTTATFSQAGTYQLRLSATDSILTSTADVLVIVNPAMIPPHTITARVRGVGGTISPSGSTSVNDGANQSFTMIPDSGYRVLDVIVDALPRGPVNQYTFSNVIANHVIEVAFEHIVINQPPTVNAGYDITVTLPNRANLYGIAHDDDLPNPPATLTSTWTKVSGPGNVDFGNVNSLVTTVGFSKAGNYTLRLTANDSQLSTSDDINIIVNPEPNPCMDTDTNNDGQINAQDLTLFLTLFDQGNIQTDFNHDEGLTIDDLLGFQDRFYSCAVNQAPTIVVNDQRVMLPNLGTLQATVNDEGLPNPASITATWSKVSGPGLVQFSPRQTTVSAIRNNISTSALFSQAGTYVVRLTANDGALSSLANFTVIVMAPQPAGLTNPNSTTKNNKTIQKLNTLSTKK